MKRKESVRVDRTKAQVLAELRAHIAQVAPVRTTPGRVPTGNACLETQLGGWPCPGISLIEGRPGMGRLGVILPTLRRLTHKGQRVVLVDGLGWLHPPGLEGVDLSQLILIQSGTRTGWVATQLARSGGFPLVVVLDPPRLGRGGRTLQHAAEQGRCAVVLISENREPSIPLSARLCMLPGGRLRILRGGKTPGIEIGWRSIEADSLGLSGPVGRDLASSLSDLASSPARTGEGLRE